jgi:Flp pilus assembly protein TadB
MLSRQSLLIGSSVAGVATVFGMAIFGNPLLVLPLALGLAVLALQVRAARQTLASDADRDEALTLLQAVTPKLRTGMPVDAAFLLAASETRSATANIVSRYCHRANYVLPSASASVAEDAGPLTRAIIAMIRSSRENGGDIATPFANLAEMIEADQRLRRRRETATLHVRAQANGLTVIAALVVLSIVFGSGVSVDYFRETTDGRLVMLGSLSVMVWGYVILSALNARIGHA